jgi:hypothetical protein
MEYVVFDDQMMSNNRLSQGRLEDKLMMRSRLKNDDFNSDCGTIADGLNSD